MIDEMLKRLTSQQSKKPGSNIYKMIKLAADQFEYGDETIKKIKSWRDIDQAQGSTLDRIGNDVGQLRDGIDDETYRWKIKLKIRANLSSGDIPTLNSLFSSVYGDQFRGVQEGWASFIQEPASIVLRLDQKADLKHIPTIKEVVAGGVSLHTFIDTATADEIKLRLKSYEFGVVYPITNMFQTAAVPGGMAQGNISVDSKAYAFDALLPITNMFTTAPENMEITISNVVVNGQHRGNDVLYKRTGAAYTGEGDI